MKRLSFLAILIPFILATITAIPIQAEEGQVFTIPFVIDKTVIVDSNISKEYNIGIINATMATVKWQGEGTGNASIYLDNELKKTIDLSADGEVDLSSVAGNMRIVLDSSAVWQGTITIRITEEFQVRVSINPSSVTLEPGQSTRVTLRIERVAGGPRYIAIQHDAPSGISLTLGGNNNAYLQDYVEFPLTISASDSITPGSYQATVRVYASDPPTDGGGGGGGTPPIIPPWGPVPYSVTYEGWHLAGEINLDMPINETPSETPGGIENITQELQGALEGSNAVIYAILALVFVLILLVALKR